MNDDHDTMRDEPERRCPSVAELAAWDMGDLSDEQVERLAEHWERCPYCSARQTITFDDEAAISWSLNRLSFDRPDEAELSRAIEKLLETPETVESESLPPDALPSPAADAVLSIPLRIGSYQLLRPLAHGAMGWVYEAEHVNLQRRVALKLLPPNRVRDEGTVERFYREMAAVGKLAHPHIVQAFDAGEADGQHYLAMELVAGCDASTLVQRLGPLPIADSCEIARQVALALQHAHMHGFVHRDVKPSNAMVAENGQVKLLDLGLASMRSPAKDQHDSYIAGTAEYMAPEQWSHNVPIDARTDLYALGCLLFKLCTGATPYQSQAKSRAALADAHQAAPIPSLRAHRANVTEDLDALVVKLLAKRPEARPESANAVARALSAFTTGADLRAAVARAVPLAEETVRTPASQTWKTPATRPRRLGRPRYWAVVMAAGLLALTGVAAVAVRRFDRGELVLTVAPPAAEVFIDGEPHAIGDSAHPAVISLASGEHVIEARQAGFLPLVHPFHLRRGVREVLHMDLAVEEQVIAEIANWPAHEEGVAQLAVSPDGRFALTTGTAGVVRQWDLETRRMVKEFSAHPSQINVLACSHDGNFFLTAGEDHTTRIWNADTCREWKRFVGNASPVLGGAISHDGRRVATGGYDGSVRVWDIETSECLWTGSAHFAWARSVEFSSDDKLVLSGGNDAVSIVWDARTGAMRHALVGQSGVVMTAQFTADAKRVLTGGYDRQAFLWDVEREERMRAYLGHAESVRAQFTPDERFILTISMDKELRLWSIDHSSCLARFLGHESGVTDAEFVPGRNAIVSSSLDGTLRMWPLPTEADLPHLTPTLAATEEPPEAPAEGVRRIELSGRWAASDQRLCALEFTPDGRRLVTAGDDGLARLWNPETRALVTEYGPRVDGLLALAVSSDGKHLATGGKDRVVRILSLESGQLEIEYAGHRGWVSGLSFMPGGPWLVSTSFDGSLRAWNTVTREPLFTMQPSSIWMRAVDFSPNLSSSYALAGGHDARVSLWEIGSGAVLHHYEPEQAHIIADVDYSPNGRLAAAVGWSGTVEVWDLISEKRLASLKGHQGAIYSVAFTADSDHLVTSGEDATVRVWSVSESVETARLMGPPCSIRAVATASMDHYIAAAGVDGMVYLWKQSFE